MTDNQIVGSDSRPGWASWHLHVNSSARSVTDRVLIEVVRPLVESHPGWRWFFVRFWQGGPHLRLRIAGPDAVEQRLVTEDLMVRLPAAARLRPDEPPLDEAEYRASAHQHAAGERGGDRVVADLQSVGVRRQAYEPETERYGGASVLAESEELFCASSELALAMVASTDGTPMRMRMALAGTMSAVAALPDDRSQADYYARGLQAWRSWAGSYGLAEDQVNRICATPGGAAEPEVVRSRRDRAAYEGTLSSWNRAVTRLLSAVAQRSTMPGPLILSSHVHMLHNRLGLGVVEELRTYAQLHRWFAAVA